MIKINDTLRFVLPMLYNSSRGLNNEFFFNEFFVGAFTSDFYRPEFETVNSVLLVYRNNNSLEYVDFEKDLISNTDILDIYSYPEEDLYVYVIQIPQEFDNDYAMILLNEFNSLSPELRLNTYKMWGLTERDTLAKVITGQEEYEGESFEEQIFKINE